ncbi:MAG TPA: hypothetical protein VGN75_00035 [Kaistia sp.]|nr:hypothetical protein [Kaistia sp.]
MLKEKEIRQYGEYRTSRLVLATWDRMEEDGTFKSSGCRTLEAAITFGQFFCLR